MADIPILRRNAKIECGQPVGQMAIKLKNPTPDGQDVQIVSFYCTLDARHRDGCAFVGNDLIVSRRSR